MSNAAFQNALARRPQTQPPIWLMRQAGRYHRHYQQLRQRYSFTDLCKEPELAAKTALGPVQDFGFDAAILFSDLLFPLEALGVGLSYTEKGPQLDSQLNETNLGALREVDDAWPRLQFQGEAVRATRAVLPAERSLIGFVGGPWTLFAYAVEGSHSGPMAKTKQQLPLFARFCDKLVPLLARGINQQRECGAEIVLILDTAAGELSPELFIAEVVPQLERLTDACAQPPGYYSKGTQAAHLRAPLFTNGKLAGVGVDYRWDMREALAAYQSGFVQGNFDPALLLLERAELERQLRRYLAPLRDCVRTGWVCGLGHGVLPGTPENNVRLFVETVREVLQ